jgi:hypothetical protein
MWTNPQGVKIPQSFVYPKYTVCENFLLAEFNPSMSADHFIKVRLSFVEIAFREKGAQLSKLTANLASEVSDIKKLATYSVQKAAGLAARMKKHSEEEIARFRTSCEELNARFLQAAYPLHYHNGFIQFSSDTLIQSEIDEGFWQLISNQQWTNVDQDIKEAIDRRDSSGRDPAFYAARALESAIKIISEAKLATTGKEKGVANFIENLASEKSGPVIGGWEAEILRNFFRSVRNPLGHGPGSAPMPTLSVSQTDWAIHFCMIWIRSLVQRL